MAVVYCWREWICNICVKRSDSVDSAPKGFSPGPAASGASRARVCFARSAHTSDAAALGLARYARQHKHDSEPGSRLAVIFLGSPILYTTTTTTQRGWCIEAFVSILAHL